MYLINRIFNPEIYQGRYRRRGYFEGWYFKIIDKNAKNIYAVIPGVSKTKSDKHAFIQIIDGVSGKTLYKRFSISDFSYSVKDFHISIKDNHFDRNGFSINIKDEGFNLRGKIGYTEVVPFPKTIFNPGIMGPFSFIPFMECYHGIVNIHCEIEGFLCINGKDTDFTGGYGYIEKDWGTSFPKSWIWLQCNHFKSENSCLMFSVASIPWLTSSFDGLISFLKFGDDFFRFATYTGAKIKQLSYVNNILEIVVEDSKNILSIKASVARGGVLKAPKNGMMDIDITESITSQVDVILQDKKGNIIFSDKGNNTGLELAGDFLQFETEN